MANELRQVDTHLDWLEIWKTENLDKVMRVFTELRRRYAGGASLVLYSDGNGALVFENQFKEKRTAIDFCEEDDLDVLLKRFEARVHETFG
jgi:hypothetical protein